MSYITGSPFGAGGISLPQLFSFVSYAIRELSGLMQKYGGGFGGGFNTGPHMDTYSPSNHAFTGSLGNCQGGYPYHPQRPFYNNGPSYAPGGNTGGSPTPACGTPATPSGGTPSPSGGGGSNASYANNMLDTLRKMNAPESLIEAYRHQYQLLGMLPSDGSTPGDPGGAPAPGGGCPSGGAPPAGGTPPPTGGGSMTPVSGGGPTSPELSGAGKVDWAKAPENLKKLQPYIQKAAAATGTPEAIIAGTIWQESGGRVNVNATDGGSDQGLMQIDNTTYDKEIAGANGLRHGTTPTDPANNIMAGATYLAMMKKKFGSWDLALRGYNSGENGVDVHDANARPAGTGDPTYVISIRQHVTNLKNGTPLANR